MDAEENTKKQQTHSLPSQAPEILRGKHGARLQSSVVEVCAGTGQVGGASGWSGF